MTKIKEEKATLEGCIEHFAKIQAVKRRNLKQDNLNAHWRQHANNDISQSMGVLNYFSDRGYKEEVLSAMKKAKESL